MAYDIEGRVPFIDKRIAGFAFPLPDKEKVRGKHGKWLLKKWLSGKYNHVIGLSSGRIWGKKRGFSVPIHHWLENHRTELGDYLSNHHAILNVVEKEKLLTLFTQALDKKGAKFIFNLLCFALWYDIHIDRKNCHNIFNASHEAPDHHR